MATLKNDSRTRRTWLLYWHWPEQADRQVASSRNKPDGLTVVTQQEVQDFLDPLPIRVIPGIGLKSEAFLHQQNVRIVRELREIPQATLMQWFGSQAAAF